MTKFMVRIGLVTVLIGGWTGIGRAVPIEVSLVRVDNSAGGAELEGFTTTDIVLTIPDLYAGSQLFIELDRGTIFQHAMGDISAPHAALVQLYPAVEFDSYVAHGSHFANGPFGHFNLTGAAVNLADRGARPLAFSESLIDIAWHPPGGNPPMDTDGFVAARITLSDDARGRWIYLASSGYEWTVVAPDDHPVHNSGGTPIVSADTGIIRSGQLHFASEIPEPATLVLTAMCLAVGAVTLRR